MNAILPDKYVRKAIYTAINNIVVNTKTIPCFDVSATNYTGDNYVIMSTQTNNQDFNKCGNGWDHSTLLDIVTRFRRNTGSRLLADDICQAVLTALEGLTLDGGLQIYETEITFPSDLTSETENEVVHRKFIRYRFTIN